MKKLTICSIVINVIAMMTSFPLFVTVTKQNTDLKNYLLPYIVWSSISLVYSVGIVVFIVEKYKSPSAVTTTIVAVSINAVFTFLFAVTVLRYYLFLGRQQEQIIIGNDLFASTEHPSVPFQRLKNEDSPPLYKELEMVDA